jgi:uncharacterized protein (TIGR03437 family)
VYVVGTTYGTLPGQTNAGGEDAFVRKYDWSGNELWTRQFGTSRVDFAGGVAVDSTGVYIGGSIGISARANGAFLRKYDVSGQEAWTQEFATLAGVAVTADTSGVYVVGPAIGSLPGQTVLGGVVRRYDASGAELWTRQFGLTSGDRPAVVAVDATGVYVGGSTPGTTLDRDVLMKKYDKNGNELWARQIGTSGLERNDVATGAAVDATGAYVAGWTDGILQDQNNAGGHDAFVAKLTTTLLTPEVNQGGVVNSASFARSPAPLAAGSIAAVFGSNLDDGSTVLFPSLGPDGKLSTSLAGASVAINGIPAPMFYATPGQLGIQIPFELAGQVSATIQVAARGQISSPRTIFLDATAPGIFTANQQGTGTVAALHQDGTTPVTLANPAHPSEVIVLFATGLGAVTPPLATGALSTGNRTSEPATVTIDGLPATVEFSGSSPGSVGLNQINVRIPPGTRTAPDIPVLLTIGGKQSNLATVPVAP